MLNSLFLASAVVAQNSYSLSIGLKGNTLTLLPNPLDKNAIDALTILYGGNRISCHGKYECTVIGNWKPKKTYTFSYDESFGAPVVKSSTDEAGNVTTYKMGRFQSEPFYSFTNYANTFTDAESLDKLKKEFAKFAYRCYVIGQGIDCEKPQTLVGYRGICSYDSLGKVKFCAAGFQSMDPTTRNVDDGTP